MKKLLLTTAAGSLLCSAAIADQWHVVTEHKNLDLIWLIDKDSMSCDKQVCGSWIAEVNRKTDRNYITALELYEVDCRKMRSRILASFGYSGGKKVAQWDETGWESYPPGTIADTVVKTICGKKPLRTHKVFNGNILELERQIYEYLSGLAKKK